MFSFHKPRVYRSAEGCCICRAKSSSSRFTDSRKYEDDSVKCFNLDKPRQGEICNACVLLVKRYKRLPIGSNRHWGHVVDARVGPGIKSMTKFKKLREENERTTTTTTTTTTNTTTADIKTQKSNFSEKFTKIFKKKKNLNKNGLLHSMTSDIINDNNGGGVRGITYWGQDDQSLSPTPDSLNNNMQMHELQNPKFQKKINRRKILKPKKNLTVRNISFIDENIWKIRKICCGMAYENSQINAIIIDLENFQPCLDHKTTSIKIKCNILQKQNKADNDIHLNNTLHKYLTPGHNAHQSNAIVLKKHHLFLKRQSENLEVEFGSLKTENDISSTQIINKKEKDDILINNKVSMLHKIKSDTGKIIKNSINKINLTTRLNPNELREIKTSMENSINLKKLDNKLILVQNKNVAEPSSQKFSDNSSDSGFDENLLDRKSISPVSEDVDKDKKQIRPPQKMFLANGIYIQGQPKNLILTGNEVASKILQRGLSHINSSKH